MKAQLVGNVRYIAYKMLPIRTYLKLLYRGYYKSPLDIDDPKRFTEKLFCLKVINGVQFSNIIKKCYDKYNVREYIIEKLGEEEGNRILNEVYGVYEDANDIDFASLPDEFALKITQGSGYNIICPKKSKLDIQETIKTLNKWLKSVKHPFATEEGYIFDNKPRIVCEKFLKDSSGKVPYDVRVFCFNGEPKMFLCDVGTVDEEGKHSHNIVRNAYDLNWNLLNLDIGRPHNSEVHIDKPGNLDQIINISKKLSKEFYFVRVDLYNIDGKEIKFGELTWIPMGGFFHITPLEYEYTMGSWLKIPPIDL